MAVAGAEKVLGFGRPETCPELTACTNSDPEPKPAVSDHC